jgi:hypothetical protein
MPVAALSIGARKAVDDRGFRDFEVWQPQYRFRGASFSIALLFFLHHPWPPRHGLIMHLSTVKLGPDCA